MADAVSIVQIVLESCCAFVCLMAFFLTVFGWKTLTRSGISLSTMFLINMVLLIADALAYAYRGNTSDLGFLTVRLSNTLVFFLQYLLLYENMNYFLALIHENGGTASRWYLWLEMGCCALGAFLVIVSQATNFIYYIDEQNLYHRQNGIVVTMGLAFLGLAICFVLLVRHRASLPRKQFVVLVLYTLVPALTVVVQTLFYGLSLMNIANTGVLVLAFVIHESERIRLLEKQALQLAQQQEQLTEQRIQLITSQMRPHFMFNALSTISSLCRLDPATAEQAVDRFADYLRLNLDTIGNQTMIPFEKELEHSKTYLWLEFLRFGDILNVEYDIQFTDFLIPPLTLQPFVENAVKHGIFPLEDGGTVKISSHRLENGVELVVQDNGTGFDTSKPLSTDRSHVGMTNVKNRITTLCHGTIQVESAPGQGTTVTIFLPLEDKT